MDRREVTIESVLIILAMQLFPETESVEPTMCILMHKPEEKDWPEHYRLMIADDKEEWTYAMSYTEQTVKKLLKGGFLEPCELEGDPREHLIFSEYGIGFLREMAQNVRKTVAAADLRPPAGAH